MSEDPSRADERDTDDDRWDEGRLWSHKKRVKNNNEAGSYYETEKYLFGDKKYIFSL